MVNKIKEYKDLINQDIIKEIMSQLDSLGDGFNKDKTCIYIGRIQRAKLNAVNAVNIDCITWCGIDLVDVDKSDYLRVV